jgi:hypothetical protein
VLFKDGDIVNYSEGAIGKQKIVEILDTHLAPAQ